MTSARETLLIVEDEALLLDLLKMMFEEEGYTVLAARDGEEALELYRANRNSVALVLSDMGLPKLGGWEVFQRLREMDRTLKVILASGFIDAAVRDEMLQQGATDVLQKPYVPQAIIERIRKLLDADLKE